MRQWRERLEAASLTLPQRRVILVLLMMVLALCVYRYARRPTYIASPQPPHGARYAELATRINPNEADWPALAVLPAIGEKRAKDIVAYRQAVQQRSPGAVAFRRREDLLKVSGIGTVLMGKLSEYLIFPEDSPPTTQP
ncbi:MAG TPA: helix-hairpin-helix domain-containing protein [Tepidisphaeraceae bacterium]